MKARLVVLYIPGVGDSRISGQRAVVRMWRLWGVHAEVLQMHWTSHESWDDKRARLLARIDDLIATGLPVALVGASAGAAAIITAYALRKSQLVGCVLIAGKINHPESIGTDYRRRNPALLDCVKDCEKSLGRLTDTDRVRILSRYAVLDLVVPQQDSIILGAWNRMVFTFGHACTIGFQLVFGAPSFLRFLRRLAEADQRVR